MKIDIRWLKHLKTEEERQKFKDVLLHNTVIFDVLDSILEQMDRETKKVKWSQKMFQFCGSAWPYQQADINGTRRTIDDIRRLLPGDRDAK